MASTCRKREEGKEGVPIWTRCRMLPLLRRALTGTAICASDARRGNDGEREIDISRDASVARETLVALSALYSVNIRKGRGQGGRMSRREGSREDEPSWRRRAYESHRSRVKTAKPTVDVNPPQGRPHVFFNAKKSQLERERQTRILRDNFILLKKLREIMHRKKQRGAEDTQRVQWQESRCVRTR
ncbi:uncharacterized protein LOC105183217 isoform X2 [Harpegnathos saltator]|uniref:uncharacterized protein LOC105183217 isoform X2 n=1 Tax=Harpegnathos saltator TaxID=610380 RepID=UPI000DBED4CB|nr:uncharacterized protein LOC105183217 isoform X2 [Harpegnathos saltator]XP_025162121.1 uncharacterized protein LOC105183217 isoform X2 [Harpegnathos saltator]